MAAVAPESPRAVGELTSRDLGAAATLSLPIAGRNVASVTSGVYNGEGANRVQNVNQDFLFVQRLLVTPFGARATAMEGTDGATYLGVGGGWLYNRIGEDVTLEEVNQYVAEVQAAWRWLDASAGSKPLRNGCSGCNCGSGG